MKVNTKFIESQWYKDIVFYLKHLECPGHMNTAQVRSLKLHFVKYWIAYENLYLNDPLGILLNHLIKADIEGILTKFPKGICGAHHGWTTRTYKIIIEGYYWLKSFMDTNKMVMSCTKCQLFVGKQNMKPFPFKSIKTCSPFQHWGLDFIGEI